jgi:hypothetical protein
MDNSILRVVKNGIGFFTLVPSGESGLTGAGIARSLGVTRESISNLRKMVEEAVSVNDLPKSLQALHGKRFYCQAKYKNSNIYTSKAWVFSLT